MKMVEKQSKFTQMISDLIKKSYDLGYQMTFAEAYRPPEMAEIYAKDGRGIKNSLHCKRLAVDFNVFKNGNLLTDGKDFEDLGKYWESLGGSWGGRFKDGNHFSLEDNGVK
ncbi:MAG: M15 family metallopeptidase [Candidatus Nitrosocosmicus sp.]